MALLFIPIQSICDVAAFFLYTPRKWNEERRDREREREKDSNRGREYNECNGMFTVIWNGVE